MAFTKKGVGGRKSLFVCCFFVEENKTIRRPNLQIPWKANQKSKEKQKFSLFISYVTFSDIFFGLELLYCFHSETSVVAKLYFYSEDIWSWIAFHESCSWNASRFPVDFKIFMRTANNFYIIKEKSY